MPTHYRLINLDDQFNQAEDKIIVNRTFSYMSVDFKELEELIYTKYEDMISLIPQCSCGEMKGGWLLNKVCPHCGTKVRRLFDNIEPIFWIEKLRDDLPFLNPGFYMLLRDTISKKVDFPRWISDTTYNPPRIPPLFYQIADYIGGRSYKNFINNIEKILIFLKNNSVFKSSLSKTERINDLIEVYNHNKDALFSDYLPIPNRRMFVMEINSKGKFPTTFVSDAVEITRFAILANNATDKRLEINTAKILAKLTKLFDNYNKEFGAKEGIIRKHIYGTRSHFTARAVITSLPTHYDYDEIHVPWIFGPTVYRPHLLNILVNRKGMNYKEADKLLLEACTRYIPEVDEVLQLLIEESPYKGLPVLIHRNPSLLIGSSQRVFITKFKTDVEDTTISLNTLIVKSPNGDRF